eukprot:CAMPEP_0202467132 /NCGR_PEP_ID=MMETSP1360-20130828/70977_1 /ASSEMBLY_ACC=CAM_ASM_000848 /TAXON_ID=515479 /ORGANISM="Licmophora paradoxa, Strain CCMP2313" /LENGTH=232 /DNA_ID=CAMNT_0049091533 /DNA_START=86 /DNA_END=784 /DNA_ORIENTATION=-
MFIILVGRGDFEGATANYNQCLDFYEKRPGEHTLSFIATLHDVAGMYQDWNNGFEDLYIAGMVHSLLGLLQKLSGNLAESRKSYRGALRIYRSIYGHDHLALGGVNNDIGELFILQEDFNKAKKYIGKAKEIHASRVGDNTAMAAEVTLNFGILEAHEGEVQEALDLLQSAQKIFNDTAHTWRQKELRKKTKRTIVAIKKELGRKKEKKKKKLSSKGGGGWKKVTTSSKVSK